MNPLLIHAVTQAGVAAPATAASASSERDAAGSTSRAGAVTRAGTAAGDSWRLRNMRTPDVRIVGGSQVQNAFGAVPDIGEKLEECDGRRDESPAAGSPVRSLPYGQSPEAWVVYHQVTAALNLTVQAVAGLVAGALALRRGTRFGRSILTGALLALVPAAFAAVQEWTSKPSIIILVPSGPRAAPLLAFIAFVSSALPCAAGAAVGWLIAQRLSARHSA